MYVMILCITFIFNSVLYTIYYVYDFNNNIDNNNILYCE